MAANQAHEAVEVSDEMVAALTAGAEHAMAFYAAGRSTLIDEFSQEDWEGFDASEEMALVADSDDVDLPDEVDCELAA
ncbi:hypothetical protein [Methylorubrum extorquens]|uniref:Uncharacterized protein n=1 Tax=Methylorubrum extorquens TaxID=408 RepID=A0AAX3WM83_METEX|nr:MULTISPECIES: hypothetical protein [Methylobacteriaceae]KQO87818.1 hypothetical protein ASF33_04975 [Methylobacterium sp. Leaf92]KQQ24751.1 hypothetical protein ASF56_02375 [Methylobacterium sp. Leaf122]WHQ71508.1 hypothetical protein KEC54_08220 [Methylorubrum extorquens]